MLDPAQLYIIVAGDAYNIWSTLQLTHGIGWDDSATDQNN